MESIFDSFERSKSHLAVFDWTPISLTEKDKTAALCSGYFNIFSDFDKCDSNSELYYCIMQPDKIIRAF